MTADSPSSSNATDEAPPPSAPPSRGASADLRGTALALDVPRAALPFAAAPESKGAPIAGPPLPEKAARPNAESPGKPDGARDLRGTALALDVRSAALPFAAAAAPAPSPNLTAPSSHGRLPTGTALALPPSGAPLPFAAESPHEPGARRIQPAALTLEQYASLCAELAAGSGEETDAIRRRYGIPDEATWQAVDGRWQAKFLFDSASRAKWLELTEQYRLWLRSQR